MNMNILEDAVKAGLIPQRFVDNLKDRKCPTCGADMKNPEFRDEPSMKEFTISGMCQKCQDSVFGDSDA